MKGIPIYCLLITCLLSCDALGTRKQKELTSPKGYQMERPERFKVRESMQEISGIVYYGDEDHIIAENDEQGKLFQVGLRATATYPSWKFGKSGDYEDVLFTGKDWLVLKSNGSIYQVLHLFTDTTESVAYHFPNPRGNEFESAYFDSAKNNVMVICKNCADDKGQGVTSVYAFSMDSMAYLPGPAYQLKSSEIPKLDTSPSKHFRPSAAALHPIEKRLYIIASINRLLVIADMEGQIQETHFLDPKHFNQPEGLTFAPNGDMYISNEGDDENTADILKFSYRP